MPIDSDTYVLTPTGALDVMTVAGLHRQWLHVIDTLRPHHLVIDLSQVTFVDGIALALFVVTATRQRRHQGVLTLVNVPTEIRLLIARTHLDALLDAPAA